MGEEDNKPADSKPEDGAPDQDNKEPQTENPPPPEKKQAEEPKDGMKEQPLPQPPQDIVLTVFMHCEGCARKVRRCLKGFEGVESVETDCRTHKVVVKGEKADPLKVLGRLQRKSHRRVELISPVPELPAANPPPEEKPKTEDNKPEPQIVTVVLKVHMHCEACAQEIKRRIHRMKGVESVDPDLKSSQVTVKGAIDPAALVEYVHRRTGKHAAIVKQEPEIAPETNSDDGANEVKEEKKASSDAGDGETAAEEDPKVVEVKKNEHHYYPPRYIMEMYPYPAPIMDGIGYPAAHMAVDAYPARVIGYEYPPQMFSDENPNAACSVM